MFKCNFMHEYFGEKLKRKKKISPMKKNSSKLISVAKNKI